jgi:aminoglycoside phosphotransferase (APT) family kinase protein
LPGPRATGFSCETVLFDAAWTKAGERRQAELAARVQPSGYTLYRHHDLDRQWRIIEAVGRQGTVPIPRIVGASAGASGRLGQPFFVMERIRGEPCSDAPPYSVRGWLKDAGAERQRAVLERSIDVLADIHAIDVQQLPADVLAREVPPGIEAQVREYKGFLDWVAAGRQLPAFERAYRWLCRELPDHDDRVFCWGDARLGNILFYDDRPAAVLDWEMAGLGPPEADLAWWLAFDRIHTRGRGQPRLPGFPPEDEIVARYEAASGRAVRDLRFYLVWATLRAAVLLFRFHDMLVLTGMAPEKSEHVAYLPAQRVLDELLAIGN